jgi:general secretion pathway protein D
MKKLLILTTCAFALSGCSQTTNSLVSSAKNWNSPNFSKSQLIDGSTLPFEFAKAIPKDKINTSTRSLVAEGATALDKGELEKASKLFNTALRMDLSNSHLHFMNALTYHLMAKGGNAKNYQFAEQGYELAHKFDETNVLAKYYIGLAYLDQRQFKKSQSALASAAVMDDKDPEILYDLARASYFAGDPRTAKASLDKIQAMTMGPIAEEKFIRASILTNAALDRPTDARKLLARFDGDKKTQGFLESRISSWERLHEEAKDGTLEKASFQLAQALPARGSFPTIPGASSVNGSSSDSNLGDDFVNADMVVVDVVIIRTQEDVSSNRGLNLLSGLQLQFGDPLTNTSGFSFGNSNINDQTAANADTKTRTVSSLISIPAVNYSLNIFNTLDGRNEILASPSLVALANEKSEFFSGVDVVAAAVSGGDGSSISVNKQIGVKLGVTPEFLPDDHIKLEIEAERTFLTSPSSSVQFEFRLDTSNTNVNANVVMKFGETLILSGLSEKETENTRDAVPLIGDIPIVQYLFANQAKRDFRKSVLIMMTPRRAQYVNQSKGERAKVEALLSDFEKSLSTFEQRNKNWFTPPPTTSEIMKVAQVNSLMNEYKTGDFQLENWNSRNTHEKRLNKAVEFLFY